MVTLTKNDGENFSTYSEGKAEASLQLTLDGSAFQCLGQPIMKREESVPLLPVVPRLGKSEKMLQVLIWISRPLPTHYD